VELTGSAGLHGKFLYAVEADDRSQRKPMAITLHCWAISGWLAWKSSLPLGDAWLSLTVSWPPLVYCVCGGAVWRQADLAAAEARPGPGARGAADAAAAGSSTRGLPGAAGSSRPAQRSSC